MNPARGEAALSVGGERLTLRPSFEALVAAEEEMGPLFALVERAAVGQHHLLVLVEDGFVHADARLRKVVERPGKVPWPALAAWRLKGAD